MTGRLPAAGLADSPMTWHIVLATYLLIITHSIAEVLFGVMQHSRTKVILPQAYLIGAAACKSYDTGENVKHLQHRPSPALLKETGDDEGIAKIGRKRLWTIAREVAERIANLRSGSQPSVPVQYSVQAPSQPMLALQSRVPDHRPDATTRWFEVGRESRDPSPNFVVASGPRSGTRLCKASMGWLGACTE